MYNFTLRQRPLRLLGLLLLAAATLACGLSSVLEEAPTAAPPTAALEAPTTAPALEQPTEAAAAPADAPTAAPSAPEPTTAPLAAPATALSPGGPWFVFTDGETLWGVNADGSGLTTLFEYIGAGEPFYAHLRGAPAGGRLAFINHGAAFYEDLTLTEIVLPEGTVTALTTLAPAELAAQAQPGAVPEPLSALLEVDNLAWSPDGSKLAYMAVKDGPSSDLYVYDAVQVNWTRLTDGPSQGVRPLWSPDGRYIVHVGVSTLGTGAGWGIEGVWAAAADDSGVITLYTPERFIAEERILGWAAVDGFVVQSVDANCGWRDLRAMTVPDKNVFPYWNGYFSQAALDPYSGSVVVTVDENTAGCNSFVENASSQQPGIFFVRLGGQVTEVASYPGIVVGQVRWDAAAGQFFVWVEKHVLAVSPTGETTPIQDPGMWLPVAASDGRTLAWYGASGLWIGSLDGSPRQVYSDSVTQAAWAPDGQTVLFFGAGGLYAASAPDFAPVLAAEISVAAAPKGVWVWP